MIFNIWKVVSLTELGNRLREAREAKGMTLDDLQQVTKIQKRYLQGIEEGNYDVMPGRFYVRAFIKQYAESVGLDSEELFEEYKSDLPSTSTNELPNQLPRVQTPSVSDRTSKVLDLFPKILIAIFIIATLALVWYFVSLKAGDQDTEPLDENNNTPISLEERESSSKEEDVNENVGVVDDEEQTKEKEDGEGTDEEEKTDEEAGDQELTVIESSGNQSTYELKNSDNFIVKVVSSGESWIEIRNGKGYSFFSGMITSKNPDGETVDLTNESEAVIVVGRASEADIYVNDEKLSYAISPTEVVKQDITIRFIRNNE